MTFQIISAELPKPRNPSYLAPSFINAKTEKIEFDPENAEHRDAYLNFKKSGKWSVQFATKWPKTIINTVEEKLAMYACKN